MIVKIVTRPSLKNRITSSLIKEIIKKNSLKINELVNKTAEKIVEESYNESEKMLTLSNDIKTITLSLEKSNKSNGINNQAFIDTWKTTQTKEKLKCLDILNMKKLKPDYQKKITSLGYFKLPEI
ncbi:hypothetical protein RF11_15146 [Thelohanellus kitauei]|uniref:Uncharacterized protein n=1 Tax=Thelohanellus kitauei TaxID=669202 RepID=A0A0C2NGZ9_THEKT|nr:hypothetical protein RF11_15146 [Thelohanellus kitauei]